MRALKEFESERGCDGDVPRAVGRSVRAPARRAVRRPRGDVVEPHAARAVVAARGRTPTWRCCSTCTPGSARAAVGMLLQTAPEESVAARLARALLARRDPRRAGRRQRRRARVGAHGPGVRRGAAAASATVGMVLEFGTRELAEVMLAVQADHWLDQHGERASELGREIARRMRDAFFLEEADWQEAVCSAGARGRRAGAARASPTFDPRGAAMSATEPTIRDGDAGRPRRAGRRSAARWRSRPSSSSSTSRRVRAGVAALLADPARGRVFVVEVGGEPVATLMLTDEWSDWRNGFFWWIQSVYVAPAHRRRGLYRLLHEHVRDLAARTDGVYGLRLYVERENHTAQATYRRMGMDETHYRLYEQSVRG